MYIYIYIETKERVSHLLKLTNKRHDDETLGFFHIFVQGSHELWVYYMRCIYICMYIYILYINRISNEKKDIYIRCLV